MRNAYPHVTRALAENPWEILEETYLTILDLAALRASGQQLTEEEVQARIGSGPAQRPAVANGAVGVVPLYGVMFPRASLFTQMSGGTSVQQWAADFERMVDDPNISAILIDCHSPGGSTYLVTETAARVRAARGRKPIVAIANTLAASACYHLASQADEVVASPSSMLGSIGAYIVHTDWSRFNETMGVDPTWVAAGKYKTEGNPDEPLDDDAKAHLQSLVDDAYTLFVNDVAKGRGVKASQVRAGYGQGRVLPAQAAVEAGLADRVDTFENTLARLAKGQVPATKARAELDEPAPTATDDAGEPADEVDLGSLRALVADTRAELEARRVRMSLQALANDMRTQHTQEATR